MPLPLVASEVGSRTECCTSRADKKKNNYYVSWSDSWFGYTLILAVFHLLPVLLELMGLGRLAEEMGKVMEHHRSMSTQPNNPTRWATL